MKKRLKKDKIKIKKLCQAGPSPRDGYGKPILQSGLSMASNHSGLNIEILNQTTKCSVVHLAITIFRQKKLNVETNTITRPEYGL